MSGKVENFSLSLSIMSWINLELARNPEFKRQVEETLEKMRREQEREKQNKLKTAQQDKLKTAQHENLKTAQQNNLKTAQCEGRESGLSCRETYDFPGQCYYCRKTVHRNRKEAADWARGRINLTRQP